MRKTIEVKLLIAFLILLAVDIADDLIKTDFSSVTIISSLLVRGGTLLTAWMIIKAFK
jgi:hypothetical protein